MCPDKDAGDPRDPVRGDDALDDLGEVEEILRDLRSVGGVAGIRLEEIDKQRRRITESTTSRYFELFTGVASSFAGELDLPTLTRRILHTAIETLRAERGVLLLGGVSGAALIPVLAVDLQGEELHRIERVSRTILQEAHHNGTVVVTQDAMKDPRFAEVPSIQLKKVRSVVCAPLLSEGESLGVLYLDARAVTRTFSPPATRFLEALAGIAAVALRNARLHDELRLANSRLESRASSEATMAQLLVGVSPAIEDLRQKALLAAQLGRSVLVHCEPGSKPELFARAVASAGPQSPRPFESLDCGTCPKARADELLLGHIGTRKRKGKKGLSLKAHGGVLFLNEVSSLVPRLQGRLARVLEDGVVRPVGSSRTLSTEIQLIAATTGDIDTEIQWGRFDSRLHEHLSAFVVRIPPLRERREDILALVRRYAVKHAWLCSGRALQFTPDALLQIKGLPLKGNDLELERLVQDLSCWHPEPKVGVRDLNRILQTLDSSGTQAKRAQVSLRPDGATRFKTLVEIEREAIRAALLRTKGNKSAAARLLGLQRNTLLRRMKRFRVSVKRNAAQVAGEGEGGAHR